MRDDLRRVALFGSGVAELTRHRAEQLARDLMEKSKSNRDELLRLIRGEIQNQITSLGVATKRDVDRLERRVLRLETQVKDLRTAPRSTAKKTGGSKKTSKTTKRKTSGASGASRS